MKYVFALSLLVSATLWAGFRVDVSESPKNNLELTLSAIQSAKKSLFINIYEFTSDVIADAIMKKIDEGVRVEILEEGQPVGKMSAKGIDLKDRIVAAMERRSSFATDRFYLMTSEANKSGVRRFRYDHAKYLIVDEKELVVGSENYSPTGHPSPGKKGTRGWETRIHDAWTAQGFLKLFRSDTELSHGDVLQLVRAGKRTFLPGMQLVQDFYEGYHSHVSFSREDSPITLEADYVEQLTSPDKSLDGLLAFIRSAKSTLDLELMSFSMKWGNTGKISPLYQEVVAAARRNVTVRVLLNDERVFGGSKQNMTTVDALNTFAESEKLNMTATIANVKAMGVNYIHNKGVLADGERVLISSINWNQNSVMNNRETAIAITGSEINRHYQALFETDWIASNPN